MHDLKEEGTEACVIERASVDAAMRDSRVQDAVVFGPGEIVQCMIERSLVYCMGRGLWGKDSGTGGGVEVGE